MLAIRLTRPAQYLTKFFNKVDENCDQAIWFQHVASKEGGVSQTHVHGLIDGLAVTVQTLKNWLIYGTERGEFPSTWTKDMWSFKTNYRNKITKQTIPCDKGMITYMSKGNLAPCHMPKGFSEWKEYRAAWVEPQYKQTKIDRRPELGHIEEDGKVTHWQMIEQIEGRMRLREYSDEALIEEIIYVHHVHKKMLSRYKIRDFFDTYQSKHAKESFIHTIKNLINRT